MSIQSVFAFIPAYLRAFAFPLALLKGPDARKLRVDGCCAGLERRLTTVAGPVIGAGAA
jgi:hypothetical protein